MGLHRQLPDGTFRFNLTCPYCEEAVRIETTRLEFAGAHHCPDCGRRFVLTPNATPMKMSTFIMTVVFALVVLPPIAVIGLIDGLIFWLLNRTSVWLQEQLNVNRHVLVLVAYAAAMVAGVTTCRFGTHWLLYVVCVPLYVGDLSLWCWKKAWEDEDGTTDVISLKDKDMLGRVWSRRVAMTLLLMFVFVPIAILVRDPDVVTLILMNIGNYWIGSDHVPPRLRRRSWMGQQSAFGT